jgi:hypothetical protein
VTIVFEKEITKWCDVRRIKQSSTVLKTEYRAVIKYLVKKGKKAKEIFEDFTETYLNFSPSYATVKRWTRLFQQGRESMQWVKKGENAPRKFKRQRVQAKLMATIFGTLRNVC